MFKFNTIPATNLPQKQTRQTSQVQFSLEEKFELYKRRAEKLHGTKFRKFHHIAFEHEGFLYVMNGEKKVLAKLENPGDRKTSVLAREVYVEVIRGHEETEGGCYFDEF